MRVHATAVAWCCLISTLVVGPAGDDPQVIWGAGHEHTHS